MAEFAESYRCLPECSSTGEVLDGTERLVQWGGDGVPLVAEFCALEYAAAARISADAAIVDIGAALGVKYRWPQLWAMVMSANTRVWTARKIATIGLDLPTELAQQVDREITALLPGWSWRRTERWLRARVIELLPARAQSDHERALARRDVRIVASHLGVSDVEATINAADAVFLDAQLTRLAEILAQGGSTDAVGARRATALGLLASPARALQLLQASLVDQLPDDLDTTCPARGQRGHTCGQVTVDPERLLPAAQVVLHLTDTTTEHRDGLVHGGKLGPLLAGWVKDLVGHTRVSVRPVLAPDGLVATDAYHCPPRMREAVELRNPYEVFPYSHRPSHGCDLDHTEPWTPPPRTIAHTGSRDKPTRLDNLGPLSRRVHRAKTHGGWALTQLANGVFVWTSPLGLTYLVTPSRSWLIHDPTGRILSPQKITEHHHAREHELRQAMSPHWRPQSEADDRSTPPFPGPYRRGRRRSEHTACPHVRAYGWPGMARQPRVDNH